MGSRPYIFRKAGPPSSKLSDEPFEALDQLIEDINACIDNPQITFDMQVWCEACRIDSRICEVCLAGAIMYNRYDLRNCILSEVTDAELYQKLNAFDSLRFSIRLFLSMWPKPHPYCIDAFADKSDEAIQLPQLIGSQSKPEMIRYVKRLTEVVNTVRTNSKYRKSTHD